MKRSVILFLTLLPGLLSADQSLQNLIQMLDYVGVDYPEAVANGKVINGFEYREMQDFAGGIAAQTRQLPASPVKPELRAQSRKLGALIRARAPAEQVAGLTARMSATIIGQYDVAVVPRQPPDLELAGELYAQTCAGCHGAEGRGDGPSAAGLEPAPTDFHDEARYRQRTLYGLYNTITLGVEGTAMPAFQNLSEHERWSLAFYVGQLAADAIAVEQGAAQWRRVGEPSWIDLQTIATTTPAEAQARYGQDAAALMAYLRTHPAVLFEQQGEPLAYTRGQLAESFARYREGDTRAAYQAAITAYLEGFELVESSLDTVDRGLRVEVEEAMTHYRNLLREEAPEAAVGAQFQRLQALLEDAQQRLDAGNLAGAAAFAASLLILLREGLEALLVVAALAAFLIKTDRRYGMPYVHAGWIAALALGVVTWFAAAYLINIGGAERELTEGIAALTAAGVLFYVGFWMHDKTHAQRWQQFIKGSVERALGRGTLWGLAGLSFVAVFREVFETILFYQALWLQVEPADHGLILAGMATALVTLAVVAWLVLRYSLRLPLRQFFAVSGIFMFILAVILAGKGIAALQEAGQLPIDPVPFLRIELLGIYPNLQSLMLQAIMVLLALSLIFVVPRLRRANS
jgi:high-affinity iron transporter